ncbi:MAG TPA: hypothetical protein PLD88_04275 [Candidatus Berkiella sp.]|nr:hypothetical protein [Candidatus Berkiella sp.]
MAADGPKKTIKVAFFGGAGQGFAGDEKIPDRFDAITKIADDACS